jgi:hypothetical protein
MMRRWLCFSLVLICFVTPLFAQNVSLPVPGQRIGLSSDFSCPVLVGLKVDQDDPLKLEFIFDTGSDDDVTGDDADRMIRYFLAGLTLPSEDLWVNLSPNEPERIASDMLAQTDLGKDMLEDDYILKQLAASLTFPETKIGKQYWDELNRQGSSTSQSLTKIWITSDLAGVYEYDTVAVIHAARLKVLGANGYYSMQKNILPLIEREVNEGRHFSGLRQIHRALILAKWFKDKFNQTFYRNYINQAKINGIAMDDVNIKKKIYDLYVEALKKGVYSIIKKSKVNFQSLPLGGQRIVNRRYFCGGISGIDKVRVTPVSDVSRLAGVAVSGRRVIVVARGILREGIKRMSNAARVLLSGDTAIAPDSREANLYRLRQLDTLAQQLAKEKRLVRVDDMPVVPLGRMTIWYDLSDDLSVNTFSLIRSGVPVVGPMGVDYTPLKKEKVIDLPTNGTVVNERHYTQHPESGDAMLAHLLGYRRGGAYYQYDGVVSAADQMDSTQYVLNVTGDGFNAHRAMKEHGVMRRLAGLKRIVISDISAYALHAGYRNVEPYTSASQVELVPYIGYGVKDLSEHKVDLVYCNPPYAPEYPKDRAFGEACSGIELLQDIIANGMKLLNPDNPDACILINYSSVTEPALRAMGVMDNKDFVFIELPQTRWTAAKFHYYDDAMLEGWLKRGLVRKSEGEAARAFPYQHQVKLAVIRSRAAEAKRHSANPLGESPIVVFAEIGVGQGHNTVAIAKAALDNRNVGGIKMDDIKVRSFAVSKVPEGITFGPESFENFSFSILEKYYLNDIRTWLKNDGVAGCIKDKNGVN